MPVYQCYSPKGLLTKSVKAKIAAEITATRPHLRVSKRHS
jgi:phenylpyruvate tautomerase PptA (4-oxalocrotonate tautomerase family)